MVIYVSQKGNSILLGANWYHTIHIHLAPRDRTAAAAGDTRCRSAQPRLILRVPIDRIFLIKHGLTSISRTVAENRPRRHCQSAAAER